MGKGGGSQTSTSTSAVPKDVLKNYNYISGVAKDVASTPLSTYGGAQLAGFTPMQNQAFSGINSAQNAYLPYFDQAKDMLSQGTSALPEFDASQLSKFMNPYQQSVIDTTLAQLNRNNALEQNTALGTAIKGGAFGGDRAGIAQAELARNQGMNTASTLAGLNSQNYQQALSQYNTQNQLAQQQKQNQLGAASVYGNLGNSAQQNQLSQAQAQLAGGTLQQQLAQQALNIPYQQWQQQQQYPFETTQWLANILTGANPGGGTTTTTQPQQSNAFSQIAGLGLGIAGLFADGGHVPGYDMGGFVVPDNSYMTQMSHAGMGMPAPVPIAEDQEPDLLSMALSAQNSDHPLKDFDFSDFGGGFSDAMARGATPWGAFRAGKYAGHGGYGPFADGGRVYSESDEVGLGPFGNWLPLTNTKSAKLKAAALNYQQHMKGEYPEAAQGSAEEIWRLHNIAGPETDSPLKGHNYWNYGGSIIPKPNYADGGEVDPFTIPGATNVGMSDVVAGTPVYSFGPGSSAASTPSPIAPPPVTGGTGIANAAGQPYTSDTLGFNQFAMDKILANPNMTRAFFGGNRHLNEGRPDIGKQRNMLGHLQGIFDSGDFESDQFAAGGRTGYAAGGGILGLPYGMDNWRNMDLQDVAGSYDPMQGGFPGTSFGSAPLPQLPDFSASPVPVQQAPQAAPMPEQFPMSMPNQQANPVPAVPAQASALGEDGSDEKDDSYFGKLMGDPVRAGLLRAGLGTMAGTSNNAFQNIAGGGLLALKGYAEDKKAKSDAKLDALKLAAALKGGGDAQLDRIKAAVDKDYPDWNDTKKFAAAAAIWRNQGGGLIGDNSILNSIGDTAGVKASATQKAKTAEALPQSMLKKSGEIFETQVKELADQSTLAKNNTFLMDQMEQASENFTPGKFAQATGSAKGYLFALGKMAGLDDEALADLGDSVGSQEMFGKNAIALQSQAVKQVSPRAAVQEWMAIGKGQPNDAMTKPGMKMIMDQSRALNDYVQAKSDLINDPALRKEWLDGHDSMDGFKNHVDEIISPSVFLLNRMDDEGRKKAFENLKSQKNGEDLLKKYMEENQIAKKLGLI